MPSTILIANEPRRLKLRNSSARTPTRTGGSSSSRPAAPVMKPETISSSPASRRRNPSTTSLCGSAPESTVDRSRRSTPTPARFTSQMPTIGMRTSRAMVSSTPIQDATCTITYSSAMSSTMSSANMKRFYLRVPSSQMGTEGDGKGSDGDDADDADATSKLRRALPDTVLGLAGLLFLMSLAAAFSGAVLYAYYESRQEATNNKVEEFFRDY